MTPGPDPEPRGPARSRLRPGPGSGFTLLLVTDRRLARGPLGACVGRALRGGVTAVMLREKDLATGELVRLGADVARACRDHGAVFVVNGDIAAARDLGADGVHLGYRAAGVAEARSALGDGALVGSSTHDTDELDRAVAADADYVTFGPVWDTASKRGILAARGTDLLGAAVARVRPVPVLALGGVTPDRAVAVRRAGAAGVACIGAILGGDDEERAAVAFVTAWESSR